MHFTTQNRCYQVIRLCVILAILIIHVGCASIEHIGLYRDARADFSWAADKDNLDTLNHLFPKPEDIKSGQTKPAFEYNFNDMQQCYDRWHHVYTMFSILNSKNSEALNKDQLLGSSKTLQIIAQLRRDLYAHILNAGGEGISNPSTEKQPPATGAPPEKSALPLTDALAQADRLLTNKDVTLYSRDKYLLISLRPMVRYEIAYVNAMKTDARMQNKSDETKRAAYLPIVKEMAQAEIDLEKTIPSCPNHMKPYMTMSRFIMLVSAQHLLKSPDKANIALPLAAIDDKDDNSPILKLLHERTDLFRKQATTPNTSENELMHSLNIKPEPDNLGANGLGMIVKP